MRATLAAGSRIASHGGRFDTSAMAMSEHRLRMQPAIGGTRRRHGELLHQGKVDDAAEAGRDAVDREGVSVRVRKYLTRKRTDR